MVQDRSDTQIKSESEQLIKWLTPSNAYQSHEFFSQKRTDGTGEWFLKGEDFNNWKRTPNSLLWLQGDGEFQDSYFGLCSDCEH